MEASAWGVIGVNSHIHYVFLNADLARKKEADSIRVNQEHQNNKYFLIGYSQQ
jgi:hypothetical protein